MSRLTRKMPPLKLHNDNMNLEGWIQKNHLILILIFLFLITGLIIGIYVKVFTQKSNKHLLYLGSNSEHSALVSSADFTSMATYFSGYHSNTQPYKGVFILQMTNSSGIELQVTDEGGKIISDPNGMSKSTLKGGVSSISFSAEGGNVILQYKNSSASNYLLRLEVEPT